MVFEMSKSKLWEDYKNLPSKEGVYILYKKNNDGVLEPSYVGQTNCIKRRVKAHTPIFDSVSYKLVKEEEKRREKEKELILKYNTEGNTQEFNWSGTHFGWLQHHLDKVSDLLEEVKNKVSDIEKNFSGETKMRKKSIALSNFFESVEERLTELNKQYQNIKPYLPKKIQNRIEDINSDIEKVSDISFEKASKIF